MIRPFALAGALLLLGSCGLVDRDGVDPACKQVRFEKSRFTVCRATPARHEVLLVDRAADGKPMRDFAGLEARLRDRYSRLAFAMNAGMFDQDGFPIGYYVEDGAQEKPLNRKPGPGNFHMQPNGVFWGDSAGWHVATTDAFVESKPAHVRFATQSGPMLLIDGKLHPRIAENGTSLQLRNAVGVGLDGTALFVISDEPVSFGRMARLFRDELAAPDALFLDGSVSRLFDPVTGRRDTGAVIGPIVVALQKR